MPKERWTPRICERHWRIQVYHYLGRKKFCQYADVNVSWEVAPTGSDASSGGSELQGANRADGLLGKPWEHAHGVQRPNPRSKEQIRQNLNYRARGTGSR